VEGAAGRCNEHGLNTHFAIICLTVGGEKLQVLAMEGSEGGGDGLAAPGVASATPVLGLAPLKELLPLPP
jgi:hypothetical protein